MNLAAWPSPPQVLLLRAALGTGASALSAWESWRARTDVEHLDDESFRLLPLLYRNLRRLAVDEALTRRYASVYKRTWSRNRLTFHAAATVLKALTAAGVDTLVLKGAALAVLHYRDAGVRAMEDMDVLVPPARLRDAIAVLTRLGWTPEPYRQRPADLSDAFLATHHSHGFRDGRATTIDLHWHASSEARQPGADDGFWAAAVPLRIEDVPTRALCTTDQLFHVCAHAYASQDPHLRWMSDATTVLRNTRDGVEAGVDWQRLIDLARARRLVLPLRIALTTLQSELDAPVPPAVLTALTAAPVSWVDRLEHRHKTSDHPYTFGKVLLRHWCWHRRSTPQHGVALVASFPTYLCRYYGVTDAWRLPALGLRRGVRRIRDFGF